jgi:hypothetical protein
MAGSIIGNNFLNGQKSVCHLVSSVGDKERMRLFAVLKKCENKENQGPSTRVSLSLSCVEWEAPFVSPHVKPNDLPLFDPLQNGSL